MRVAFYTLGCKANQYDSQAMQEILEQAGHVIVPFGEETDAFVINTCTVTGESDRKARQVIGRARRICPDALLCVCGCYAQRSADRVLMIPGVDVVMGTAKRGEIAAVLEKAQKGVRWNLVYDIAKQVQYEEGQGAFSERARAHIKIQDGCDRYCTYCIIPYTRGPMRFRALEEIAREAKKAAQAGYWEAVLTGIRIAAYHQDEKTLMDAVDAACQGGIYRVRLGSLDPDCLDDAFIKRAAENPHLCRHFHLSLQSGSDTVLRRMARHYTTAQYLETVEKIREAMPDAVFTTDVLCGFPGETEEEFAETLAFVKRVNFLKVHAFPYSQREGTAAARMRGQVSQQVKHLRTRMLIDTCQTLEQEHYRALRGTVQEVIFEQKQGVYWLGHARNYAVVQAADTRDLAGQMAQVHIMDSHAEVAEGQIRNIIKGGNA